MILGGGVGCSSSGFGTERVEGPREVDAAVARVRASRLKGDVERMEAFGTRHTLSETLSEDRGIGAARRWVKSEFERALAGASRCRPVNSAT